MYKNVQKFINTFHFILVLYEFEISFSVIFEFVFESFGTFHLIDFIKWRNLTKWSEMNFNHSRTECHTLIEACTNCKTTLTVKSMHQFKVLLTNHLWHFGYILQSANNDSDTFWFNWHELTWAFLILFVDIRELTSSMSMSTPLIEELLDISAGMFVAKQRTNIE